MQGHGGPVQPTAQHFVSVDDHRQRRAQLLTGHAVGQPDGFGLCQPAWLPEFVEPVSVGQQRYWAGCVVGFGCDVAAIVSLGVYRGGELANAAAFQHQPRPQREATPAGRLHDGERGDAVQAQLQEVGVRIDPVDVQYLRRAPR